MGTTSKALDLLGFFSRQRPQVGLSDLSRLSGINKATCYRLMSELVDHGLAEQVLPGKEYRIGPAVLRLAALREATVPTREAALPVLQALATATGETAHMSHLVVGQLATLAFAYSAAHGMRVMMEDADILPFHATASGYAVMAWLDRPAQERILAAPMRALTEATPVDPAAVMEKVTGARSRGFAFTSDTFELDVSSFAVPLFDPRGVVQGSLAVAAAGPRLTDESRAQIPRRLIAAAWEVMALWGGNAPTELSALWRRMETTQEVQS